MSGYPVGATLAAANAALMAGMHVEFTEGKVVGSRGRKIWEVRDIGALCARSNGNVGSYSRSEDEDVDNSEIRHDVSSCMGEKANTYKLTLISACTDSTRHIAYRMLYIPFPSLSLSTKK